LPKKWLTMLTHDAKLELSATKSFNEGGQANPLKSRVELGLDSDFDDMLDLSFSKQYPQFCTG
jgi:hypothetical protein